MRKRVFIVEDDHTCETVLRRTIQAIAPSTVIDWEDSAERAIATLKRETDSGRHYDLIIADIFLEGDATGLELWRACERNLPDTSVLITSSLSVDRFLQAVGRDSVAPPFLPKPFYVGECRQILEGLLDVGGG